jgi:hypothetical protein
MFSLVIPLVVVAVGFGILLALGLCNAAARGDEIMRQAIRDMHGDDSWLDPEDGPERIDPRG